MITIEQAKLTEVLFELDMLRNQVVSLPDCEAARGVEYHADNLAMLLAEIDPSRRVVGSDVDGWPLKPEGK